MIGSHLGHYEILGKLGAGGMGEVYRARDTRLDREVALKILPPDVASDPDRRSRFEREARAVAALRHPGIVTIHAVEEDGGVPFIAMELVEGRTLSEVVRDGGLSLRRFLEIALPLVDAVAAAHAKGITHRDLKPDNVMVEPDGRVKVLDFGLAKLMGSAPAADLTVAAGPHPTQEGSILGTVAYMSPEQAEGKPVDPRSDVFSLGVVFYEMLTGERPFHGDTQLSTLTSLLRDTPPAVHERNVSAPRELDPIVQRCLEKSPQRRYPSARELGDELDRLRVGTTSPSAHPGAMAAATITPLPPGVRRRWMWIAAGVVAVALAGGWILFSGREDVDTDPSPHVAAADAKLPTIVVFPFQNLGSAADAYFAAGVSDEITSRLSALQGLGVLSRTSALQYDRTGKTMQDIAADLGVDWVLDGTVRWARSGDGANQVRITPQLASAREDRQVWSASYDRSMDEIFRIQTEIAAEVVDNLGMALAQRQRAVLAAPPTSDVEAYHAFLRATELLGSITFLRGDYDRGSALLEEACARDPRFLRAFAEMARAQAGYVHFAWDTSEERRERARRAAERALEIDADSPWSQLGLGYYLYWGRKDYDKAYAAFSRAREGLPSSSEAVSAMAMVRRRQGRFEDAAAQLQEALALDPRNPMLLFTLGETQATLGRYEESARSLERAAALAPDPSNAHALGAHVASLAGDCDGARALLARSAHGPEGGGEVRSGRFWTAVACRDLDTALTIAGEFSDAANRQFSFESRPAARGWALMLRGDPEEARGELERARTLHESYVRDHPDEANVRSSLGLVLAALGRHDDALREARLALTLPPATTDAWIRQFREYDLAIVEILAGRHDDAIRHLEELMARSGDHVSVELLRTSPLFDPLRDDPAFVRLVEAQSSRRAAGEGAGRRPNDRV